MEPKLLHIFRNSPFGRETLLQSIYFCKQLNILPIIYIPKFTKFLMYFENDVIQIDLDNSYLTSPKTAVDHVKELINQANIDLNFLEPKNFTASTLPDIPSNFDFMCCPRSISDLSSKIGLGHIGQKVRRIVKSARFPVLITSPVYKKWESIMVFFGGSGNALNALKLGLRIKKSSGMPLEIFTQLENNTKEFYEKIIKNEGLDKEIKNNVDKWHTFSDKKFNENLYNVPHDSLVILGAYGHGVIKDIIFGSKMENIQSIIPNNLLIVGPNDIY